jgi:hypothetical protein
MASALCPKALQIGNGFALVEAMRLTSTDIPSAADPRAVPGDGAIGASAACPFCRTRHRLDR